MFSYTTCTNARELKKDAQYCFQQILEAAPFKRAAVWLFIYHLTNYLSKTSENMLGIEIVKATSYVTIFHGLYT